MRHYRIIAALLFAFLAAHRAQSATLKGYVTDPDGQPVAGASVKGVQEWVVEDSGAKEKESLSREGVSGTDGAFILEELREKTRVELYTCLDGYATVAESVSDSSETAWIALAPPLRITGRILDSKRRPIAGAKVKLHVWDMLKDSPCPGSFSTLSSKDGSFRLEPAPPGYDSLEVHPQGFLSARRVKLETPVDQNLDGLDIVLAPEATITGVVRDLEGMPVAGASIQTSIQALANPRLRIDSGSGGTYRLNGLPVGEHEIELSDFGYATTRRTIRITPGENRHDLTLGPKLKTIQVRLVGPDGEPVKERKHVRAVFPDGKPCSSGHIGETGSFELQVVHPDPDKEGSPCRITVSDVPGPDYFRSTGATFIIGHEPTDVIEARLNRGALITGRVLGIQPEELPQVKIRGTFGVWDVRRSSSSTAVLDATGVYRLEGIESEAPVDPGQVRISAVLGIRGIQREVTLQPGQTEAVLDLEFPSTYPVHGRVLGPDGEALEGAMIGFYNSLGNAQTQTGVDGSFSLELHKGEYGVGAQHEGYGTKNGLKLVVTDAAVENFEIRMRPASSRIRVQLLGLEPWERAYVTMDTQHSYAELESDNERTYQSYDLADGEWEVTATVGSNLSGVSNRGAHSRVTLKPGQETLLDLDLHNGPWTLSGHLFKAGEPFAASLSVRSEDSSRSYSLEFKRDGSFYVPRIHSGVYRLRAWDSESKEYREWTLEISSDLYRTFEWAEGAAVSGY